MSHEEKPLECPECGSMEFEEVEFCQFYKSTYSAVPGGELYAVPSTPVRVRRCLCGYPIAVVAASVPRKEWKSFEESLRLARRCRAARDYDVLQKVILHEYATAEQARQIHEEVRQLRQLARVIWREPAEPAPWVQTIHEKDESECSGSLACGPMPTAEADRKAKSEVSK